MIEQIRTQVAKQLIELDGVIGLHLTDQGTTPYLFQERSELEQLVIEPRYPLSETVSRLQKRFREANFGIVARGCDTRALVEMVKRHQIDPDRLYLVGIACSAQQADSCFCAEPAPDIEQWPRAELIGEPVPSAPPNPLLADCRNMSREERWEFWKGQFVKCIKCYGCRNICPVCFCEACALEDPLWVEPGLLVPDFPMYHLIKAMHMTTRCIACRQCELACPADIPLTVLYELIRDDVADLIGYIPGENLHSGPPLSLTLADAPMKSDLVY
jgi:ferredoxin